MNKTILTGNLCKNVELRQTQTGTVVMQNTLAIKNDFKNAEGNYESQFINIVAFNKTAEFLNNYCNTKGSKILVEGRISTRQYEDKDSKKVYVTEVIAEKVEILNKKDASSSENTENDYSDELPF